MFQTIVRINEIELNGFKNVQYGRIKMRSALGKDLIFDTSDILGIYGQNGSGKTAVIEAMDFIQTLLTGQALHQNAVHYISKGEESCTIKVKFHIRSQLKKAIVSYMFCLNRVADEDYEISREVLRASVWDGERFGNDKTLIDYEASSEGILFSPKFRFEELIRGNDENKVNLSVAKKIAQKERVSFIFGTEGRAVFLNAPQSISEDYNFIIKELYQYARMKLFVISSAHSGAISMNMMIPFAFRLDFDGKVTKGDLPIMLGGPSLISKKHFDIINNIVNNMNIVLDSIVPGLSIGVYDFGEQLLGNGSEGHKVELISKRGEAIIPLRYESEGIVKIISVLNALMCVYIDPSTCLIIDELDSGIYEYLLGELLAVFEKGAKGQLIFTSHNLRALEMVNKDSIVFSTANAANRYIRLQNVKNNNNLRDMYLRSIVLGGQKENIYAETDSVEIGRAFRRAGKAVYGDHEK